MVLSGDKIHERLKQGQIFKEDTWSEDHLKEASYALRLAEDGLLVDGKFYDPDSGSFHGDYVNIEPGKIAILSTEEILIIPSDLMGKVGIRLDHALLGLTGLMGIQVDPFYGLEHGGERLYVRVANLGNDPIRLTVGEEIFTFELHEVTGDVERRSRSRTWDRLKDQLRYQSNASWTYVTQVESDLSKETQNVRESQQPVVLFGVFLVAATILSVAISLALNYNGIESAKVPSWFDDGGWVMLMITFVVGTIATVVIGVITALQFFKNIEWNVSIKINWCKRGRSRSSK